LSVSINEKVSSAVDLRNASENFGAEILNNLNSVKNASTMSHSEFRTREGRLTFRGNFT